MSTSKSPQMVYSVSELHTIENRPWYDLLLKHVHGREGGGGERKKEGALAGVHSEKIVSP